MPTPAEFAEICAGFRQGRQAIDKVFAAVREPQAAAALKSLCNDLDSHFAQMESLFPQAQAELLKVQSQARQSVAKAQGDIDKTKAELAKGAEIRAHVEKHGRLPEAPPQIDPKLAEELRLDLLGRFPFGDSDPPPVGPEHGDLWQTWDWSAWSKS
jgi:hypothetical protein